MKNYLKIGEFAKLRNVNINSLLYYEKLGILKPIYVDPKSQYRYYTAEQLPVLDTIILCINLGIPLKSMSEYIDGDGHFKFRELLTQGKELAHQHINDIQTQLYAIERSLTRMENDKAILNRQGIYTRRIEKRQIVTTPFFTSKLEFENIEIEINQLYTQAQKNKLSPILPAGVLIECDNTQSIRHCFFLEIANKEIEHPQILTLPAGEYSCFQMSLPSATDIHDAIMEHWGSEEKLTIIVNNIYLERFSFSSRPAELQRKI